MSNNAIEDDVSERIVGFRDGHRTATLDGAMEWLDRAFRLESLADQRNRPVAQNVIIMCALQSVLGLSATLIDLFGRGEFLAQHLIGFTVVAILAALPLFLIRTHRVHASAWVFCTSISLGLFLICFISSGILSATTPMLLLPIYWAWMTLKLRGAIFLSALTLVEFAVLTYMAETQLRPDSLATIGVLSPALSSGVALLFVAVSAIVTGFFGWYNAKQYEARLIRMRDEARQANRQKAEFIASVAHEVRTPLTGLMGMLELMKADAVRDDQKEMTSTARSSARNILNLINDLLDLSKIEVGELRLLPEPVDASNLFHETANEFRQYANRKKLEFTVVGPAAPVWLLLDPVRFRQILSNFLSNALKFTEAGAVRVRLTVDETDTSQVRLLLSVEDTGPGIPHSERQRIFARFAQVDSAQRATYKGTGLGLAIVKDLARLQGGDVWVESDEAVGSTFFFTAQYKRTSALELPAKPRADNTDTTYRILIADDSVGNQRVISRVLQGLGYETVSVSNGSDAVVKIADERIDLVLMDLRMPVKDGPTALKDIRALPDKARSEVPVIGLSADNAPQDMARWIEAGVDGFIQKPVDFENMDHTIRRILGA